MKTTFIIHYPVQYGTCIRNSFLPLFNLAHSCQSILAVLKAIMKTPSFLLLGDSITQLATDPSLSGFQCLMEKEYVRRVDIFNRGLSGYTTR